MKVYVVEMMSDTNYDGREDDKPRVFATKSAARDYALSLWKCYYLDDWKAEMDKHPNNPNQFVEPPEGDDGSWSFNSWRGDLLACCVHTCEVEEGGAE